MIFSPLPTIRQRRRPAMNAPLKSLLISVAALILAPMSSAQAHESRPAYLEINETSPGRFDVLWRTPLNAGIRSWRGETSFTIRHPWAVVFAFGLLHGFGFAGALTGAGLPRGELPIALLGFNVGVEIGQVAFVSLVML